MKSKSLFRSHALWLAALAFVPSIIMIIAVAVNAESFAHFLEAVDWTAWVGSIGGLVGGVLRVVNGNSPKSSSPKLTLPKVGVSGAVLLVAAGSALVVSFSFSAGCTKDGHLRPDVAEALVDVFDLSCDGVSRLCVPGNELIGSDACRWLVPGCYGVTGLAGLFLRAGAVPEAPEVASRDELLHARYSPDEGGASLFLANVIADCKPGAGDFCDRLVDSYAAGRDVAIRVRR